MALHGFRLREVRGLCAGAAVIWALSTLSGCVSAQAKNSSDKLPLDVPPPPPHVVELPAEPLEPVGEIPSANTPNPGAPRAPRPPAPKPQTSDARPEGKPDTPPGQPATPAETPAPVPPPAPAPQLRTPQTADASAAAKVHATIEHARSSLNNVDFRRLNNERQKAYNDVKAYCLQAEEALKEGNVVFAQAVATKAEKLALELAGR